MSIDKRNGQRDDGILLSHRKERTVSSAETWIDPALGGNLNGK